VASTNGISIIVPVGPDEKSFLPLIAGLKHFPRDNIEILFVCCQNFASIHDKSEIDRELLTFDTRWIITEAGRAKQQNEGAHQAKYAWLWFLHVDSMFDAELVRPLLEVVEQASTELLELYCFHLAFYPRSRRMSINAFCANKRTQILSLPFGDQAFFLSKKSFQTLGAFDERADYGEDHLLAWALKHRKGKLICFPGTIRTSDRKYRYTGWLRQTAKHQWLWLKQVWQQKYRRDGG
jgi:hypothetical protein